MPLIWLIEEDSIWMKSSPQIESFLTVVLNVNQILLILD